MLKRVKLGEGQKWLGLRGPAACVKSGRALITSQRSRSPAKIEKKKSIEELIKA